MVNPFRLKIRNHGSHKAHESDCGDKTGKEFSVVPCVCCENYDDPKYNPRNSSSKCLDDPSGGRIRRLLHVVAKIIHNALVDAAKGFIAIDGYIGRLSCKLGDKLGYPLNSAETKVSGIGWWDRVVSGSLSLLPLGRVCKYRAANSRCHGLTAVGQGLLDPVRRKWPVTGLRAHSPVRGLPATF